MKHNKFDDKTCWEHYVEISETNYSSLNGKLLKTKMLDILCWSIGKEFRDEFQKQYGLSVPPYGVPSEVDKVIDKLNSVEMDTNWGKYIQLYRIVFLMNWRDVSKQKKELQSHIPNWIQIEKRFNELGR